MSGVLTHKALQTGSRAHLPCVTQVLHAELAAAGVCEVFRCSRMPAQAVCLFGSASAHRWRHLTRTPAISRALGFAYFDSHVIEQFALGLFPLFFLGLIACNVRIVDAEDFLPTASSGRAGIGLYCTELRNAGHRVITTRTPHPSRFTRTDSPSTSLNSFRIRRGRSFDGSPSSSTKRGQIA